ncbi:CHRD domain-containing protein [Cyanobacterium stanieri LEGE 03274]|uniref:CHRD domain-containing protein n=1 Tax=Cyanobacterium stanieri LEGE 03274 TaxID=1828756 RepID=A0ABR9V453_9CHRO|nr:CHRD domain-containing protein [Cyanobacterium stanieri]MBE9222689.1 CHRD domain-containing protein [Cyanobacterium stanieri LEGE 03274]
MNNIKSLFSKLSVSAIALIFATNFTLPSNALNTEVESESKTNNLAQMNEEGQMMMEESPSEETMEMGFKVMTAMLSGNNIYPQPVTSNAGGVAVAILSENNTLMVYGSFNGLSSPLRDYESDPLNPPNPDVTSAVHLHLGTPEENGTFVDALSVTTSENGLSGLFTGTYQLSDEQVMALGEGNLYIDIHTTMNRGGELRGIIQE